MSWVSTRYGSRRSARMLPADFLLTVDDAAIIEEPERAVATAGLLQVRQSVYRSAVGRWQAYAGHLQPLLNALGHLAPGGSTRAEEPHV